MIKYTFATAVTVLALLSGNVQAEQTNFDGLTVSGSLIGQGIDFVDDGYDAEDTIHSTGLGIQFDYSINRIVSVTGGYTNTSADDKDLDKIKLDLDTERFYSGFNLGYRFEGESWAVKPFGAVGFNTIKSKFSYEPTNSSDKKSYNKLYAGAGVAVSYKQLTATLETDISELEQDVLFVESRLTLGYRFQFALMTRVLRRTIDTIEVKAAQLMLFSSQATADDQFFFTDHQLTVYAMLIIPTIIVIAYIFFKAGEFANKKRNIRVRTEKAEAYKILKSYCLRIESLTKKYELEKQKVTKANNVIRNANIQIACLKAGLVNVSPVNTFHFFEDLHSHNEIKKRYKLLSAAYHPDKGGNQHTMQLINEQYRETYR